MVIFAHVMTIPIEPLNFQILNVGFARHNRNWNWHDVMSPFTRIYLVTEGEAKIFMQGSTVVLKPGFLYIVPAHTMHSYECNDKFSHYYLHFFEGLDREVSAFDAYEFPQDVKAGTLEEQLFRQMCRHFPMAELPASDPSTYDNIGKFMEYAHRYNDFSLGEKTELRGCVLLLFSRFAKEAKARAWTQDKRMAETLKYIQSNIGKEIKIEDLASVMCVTESHFIRLFSKSIGVSPLKYINKKKMERAQLMLITEDLSVKEIAYRLGFGDHSYFIRLFKKMTHVTPLKYRSSMT